MVGRCFNHDEAQTHPHQHPLDDLMRPWNEGVAKPANLTSTMKLSQVEESLGLLQSGKTMEKSSSYQVRTMYYLLFQRNQLPTPYDRMPRTTCSTEIRTFLACTIKADVPLLETMDTLSIRKSRNVAKASIAVGIVDECSAVEGKQ